MEKDNDHVHRRRDLREEKGGEEKGREERRSSS